MEKQKLKLEENEMRRIKNLIVEAEINGLSYARMVAMGKMLLIREDLGVEHMEISKKNRIFWLDIERDFAIFSVVLIHALESVYKCDLEEWGMLSPRSRFFRTLNFSLGRLGVPVFLFLSGYILLARAYDNEGAFIKFYKKKLLKLLFAAELWIIIYDLFGMFSLKNGITLEILVKNLLFLKPNYMSNMWYMPMILGVYIAVPFLGVLLPRCGRKVVMVPLTAGILAFFISPDINRLRSIFGKEQLQFLIDTSFFGGTYGIYLIIGHLEQRKWLERVSDVAITAVGFVSFAGVMAYQYICYHKGQSYNVWYNHFPLLVCSVCVFEGIKRYFANKSRWIFKRSSLIAARISDYSLSIFFLHAPILSVLSRQFNWESMRRPAVVYIRFIITFMLSYMFASGYKRMENFLRLWIYN